MKVMLVDDDREFADELADILHDAGYKVEVFSDSVVALDAAPRVKPAVILLDLQMEKINGYQTAWYLRTSPETVKIPIIGISGYQFHVDPARIAATCGMNAFMQKPFSPVDLIARIEQLTGFTRVVPNQAKATVAGESRKENNSEGTEPASRPAPAIWDGVERRATVRLEGDDSCQHGQGWYRTARAARCG